MKKRAIGIFDSGIGGLTVASAIKELLPFESIVYFGDTAHVPYGDKSGERVKYYSRKITEFLVNEGCKMVVIACNTASSRAWNIVVQVCGEMAIPVNVIDPVASYISTNFKNGTIGIIGTKGTIASRIYPRKIKALNPKLIVRSKSTPLLAPMIEEGFFNNMISHTVVRSYLDNPQFRSLDALVLGCTHYPLIKSEIDEFYDHHTAIIDSAQIVAAFVKKLLKEKNLEAKGPATYKFYVSDYTDSFKQSTRFFFKEKIALEESPIWA